MPKIICPHCQKEFKKTKKELFPPKEIDPLVSKGIVDIMEVFVVNSKGSLSYAHKGHRTDAQKLIALFGAEQALSIAKMAILVLNQIPYDQFAPVITNPTALLNKFVQLNQYLKRHKDGGRVVEIK